MSLPNRRAVLTGIGVLTPLGHGAAAFWDGLSRGASGIRPITAFDATPLPTRIAGDVRDFDVKKYIPSRDGRKNIRVMARSIQLAVAAAQLAMDDTRIDRARLDSKRFGVEFGAGLIASELPELGMAAQCSTGRIPGHVDLEAWGEKGLSNIPPLWMLKYLPNMFACHVSILHDAQGPNNTITESDVASLLAVGEACRILRRDQADFFLVGGADSKVNPLSMVRQTLWGRMTKRNDTPEAAVRPFDLTRDGYVIGEGAGVLVIEELEHARRRGAKIYGEVLGFGAAFDRGMTGKGIARALRIALAQAGLAPEDIDHVNAHGLGSLSLDAAEARGIAEVFGARKEPVPVWTIKSAIGHLGAGGGTTELAASLLAIEHGTLPRTLNFATPDPACPVAVQQAPRPIRTPYFAKVGYTELGQVAAVVCRGGNIP
jgi:3-oxoacyl-[acyl-carrier-protein] synthase II